MSVLEIEHPVVVSECVAETTIPTPFFGRFNVAEGQRLVVQIVGSDEDLQSLSSFPTLGGAIEWRGGEVAQSVEPQAWLTLVIWSSSYLQEPPLSLRASRRPFPTLIAYRTPDAPPQTLDGQPTSLFQFTGSVGNLVRRLISSLIIPVAFEGAICVAEQDIEEAVNRGGTVRQFVRRSDDVQAAFAAILRDIKAHLLRLRPEAAVCLGILVGSSSLDMKLVDEIGSAINGLLHPGILLVISAVAHSGPEACISVLTTAGTFSTDRTRALLV